MNRVLADPRAAREHARAQAGGRCAAMPVLPPEAHDLPDGVSGEDLLWEETIAAGGYATRRMNRGARLRLIDLAGDACASMLVFNAEMPSERLNIADTAKVQWNGYLRPGVLLLSDMGRVLMSILEDTAGTHDLFCGPSTAASNAARYGDGSASGPFPNARDRLLVGAGKHGLSVRDVHPSITFFKGARIGPDGAITPVIGPFEPGRHLILRCEMDVIVVVANCPHVLDPRDSWQVGLLRATAWRGPVTGPDDPVRQASPEGLRAFLNTEDYYRR
ncbi:urea amidolyase associated protein UAAP1 [Thermaurantiacus sp.]